MFIVNLCYAAYIMYSYILKAKIVYAAEIPLNRVATLISK